MSIKARLFDGSEIEIELCGYVAEFNRIHIGIDFDYDNPVPITGADYTFFEKDTYYVFSKNKWGSVELSGFKKYHGKDLLLANDINLLDFFVEIPFENLVHIPNNKEIWIKSDEIYTRKILKCVKSVFIVAPFDDSQKNKDVKDLQPYVLSANSLETFTDGIETLLNTYKRMLSLIK